MRQAKRRATTAIASVAAPVGGLNARDSIANMEPTDAILMDNWVPGTTSVNIRNGYLSWATGIGGPVNSLMHYRSATAAKMFAASGANIYDATAQGAVGAAVATGFTSDKWQYVNFSTPGGWFMPMVNGSDALEIYDGTNWYSNVPNIKTISALQTNGQKTITNLTTSGSAPYTDSATLNDVYGLVVGQPITIAGVVPSAHNGTFTITTIVGNVVSYVVSPSVNPGAITNFASATFVNNVAPFTDKATLNNVTGLFVGDTIVVAGVANAGHNGAFTIATIVGNDVTYQVSPSVNPGLTGSIAGATLTKTVKVTGTDTSQFKDVQVYARRLWYTQKNSFVVWYGAVNSIFGALSSIDLSSLFTLGGSLQGMVTWSVTSELSSIQYAAFVSSEGEVLLYSGTNPDSATGFNLVGQFRIGKPVGQRFYAQVGGDVILITQDGLIPLSKAAIFNRQSQSDAISYKITNLVNLDIEQYGSQFGWQVILYPLGNKIFLNSPRTDGTVSIQYVMNTLNNSWCRYTNLPALSWVLHEDEVYYGSNNGTVYLAENGQADGNGPITADVMPAFSYFRSSRPKIFTAVRPVVTANGQYRPSIGLGTDYNTAITTSNPTLSSAASGSPWNTSPWDISPWEDAVLTSTDWEWLGGIGSSASMRMTSLTNGLIVQWASTDYTYETGTGVY